MTITVDEAALTARALQSCNNCYFYVGTKCKRGMPLSYVGAPILERTQTTTIYPGEPIWPTVEATDWCGFWNVTTEPFEPVT